MNKKYLPSVLYKYYPPRRWKHVFNDWTIRFSPLNDLNDPFECLPYIKWSARHIPFGKIHVAIISILKELKKHCKSFFYISIFLLVALFLFLFSINFYYAFILIFALYTVAIIYVCIFYPYIDSLFSSAMAGLAKHMCGAISMTTQNDNILMWSHYGESHKGFVLSLNTSDNFFAENQYLFPRLEPVTYSRFRMFSGETSKNMDYMFHKGSMWKYEDEWKFAISLFKSNDITNSHNAVFQLPKSAICGVIFGILMKEEEIIEKCRFIKSQHGCDHIALQRATIHPKHYKIIIKNISKEFYKNTN